MSSSDLRPRADLGPASVHAQVLPVAELSMDARAAFITRTSVGMVALAGASILHDTSKVIHHYSEDRYVGAALELFAGVALLFWYVLRLFLSRRD